MPVFLAVVQFLKGFIFAFFAQFIRDNPHACSSMDRKKNYVFFCVFFGVLSVSIKRLINRVVCSGDFYG